MSLRRLLSSERHAYIADTRQNLALHVVAYAYVYRVAMLQLQRVDRKFILIETYSLARGIATAVGQLALYGVNHRVIAWIDMLLDDERKCSEGEGICDA